MTHKKHSIKTILTFIIPSLIGLLLFMTPINVEGSITIPIAIISKALQSQMGSSIQLIMTCIVVLMALASLLTQLINPKFVRKSIFLRTLLKVNLFWLAVRILGAIFIVMVYWQVGPEAIISSATGGLVLNDLVPVLFSVFIFAGMLLPLLLNFGLLEFFGTL